MTVLTSLAVIAAVAFARQQLPIGPLSIDLNYWGSILMWVGAMSATLYGLYLQWGRPVVRWFVRQGRIHEQIADDITHIRTEQTTLTRRVDIIERVVFPPPLAGGEGEPPVPFYRTQHREDRP